MSALACLLIFTAYPAINSSLAATTQIQSDSDIATAGYYQLSWSNADPDTQMVVEESNNSNFDNSHQIYVGSESSTVISGKQNGDYFYRVKNLNSMQWSEVIKVTVVHHSLPKAFLFFFVGLFIFTSTVVVIVKNRKLPIDA